MNEIEKKHNVLSTYRITHATYALIPTRSIHHQTKVIEENNIYYVKQSPIELIKLNCLLNGAEYNGRRKAIAYHLNFKRKVPMAISKTLHAFPTHSITDFDCIWLFLKPIAYVKAHTKESKVIFKNNFTLNLPISIYILQQQNLRCFAVSNLFKQIKHKNNKSHQIVTKLV